jgi:RHS repeat-associated protein
MNGISSKAAGNLPNKEKTFQGQQFDDDLGINYVEFRYRNHDPQIGRFIEIDPLSNDYVYNSTYAFSENKVTSHIELEGLESLSIQDVWRSAGISSSTDPMGWLKDFGKGFTKTETYTGALNMIGPMIGAAVAGLMTDGILSGTGVAAEVKGAQSAVTTTTAETTATTTTTEETVTLHRGVNKSSPAFDDALQGNVKPRGGNATPAEHNVGNTKSNYTSWTTDVEVAKNYSLRPDGGGVVLQTNVPVSSTVPSPSLKSVNLKQSPGVVVNEREVLLKGPIKGCQFF